MISIIIPIYKAEVYLKDCLLSIQKQTYTDFEAICVNDGSPDNSAAICQEFIDKDARFILINKENGGVSSARNRALKEAKGDYICFVDSDDMIESHYLETLLNLASDGAFAVCSYSRDLSKLTSFSTRTTEYGAKEFIHHILNESIEHPNICMMLFKNSIIQTKHLEFTIGCARHEDCEFYIKYLLHEDFVISSDYKGYYYRINDESAMHITTKKSLTGLDAAKRIGKLLFENGYTNNINIDLYPSIQSLLYHLARENNLEIYEFVHREYDIKKIMKELLFYKSIKRKSLSVIYLILGKNMFFRTLSSNFAKRLPL